MSGKNSFLNIVKDLEKLEENQGYLILVRCGAFFVSIGVNAVILSDELALNTICMVKGICKIGIPLNSLYDYIKRLEQLEYSFVIYNYSKDEMIENGKRYAEMYRSKGKYVDKSQITINCEECEKYMQYMIETIIKMPRTEKFNIGNELKTIMYRTLENILYVNKIEISKRMYYLNLIDAELSTQRVMLRLMVKNRGIDEKKFKVSMEMIYEIGKILGGLIKQYAKNNKK